MLTKARLIELGFIENTKNIQRYFQKGRYCLFPEGAGCWNWGIDDGTIGIPNNSIIICTEEQLNEAIRNAG